MKAAKPQDLGLLRRHFQTELSEPFRQRPVEAFSIFFETKRTYEIIGIAAHHGLTAHLLLCHFLKPEVERIV